MTARPHVIVDADGKCVNCVELESAGDWHDETQTAHPYDGLWRQGWRWNGQKAVDPNPPPPRRPSRVY